MPIASNAIAVSAIASRPQAGAAMVVLFGESVVQSSANRITQVRADAETQATANNATRQTVSCCR